MQVLDSVPDLDMLAYLPQLLDGLMNMLSDPNREIRVAAEGSMTVGREPEREGGGEGCGMGGRGGQFSGLILLNCLNPDAGQPSLCLFAVCATALLVFYGDPHNILSPHFLTPYSHTYFHTQEFLMEIHTTRTIDFNGLSRILVDKSYSQVWEGGGAAVGGQRADVQGGMVRIVNQPFPSLASLYICSPSPEPPPSPLPQDEHTRLTALRWLKNFVEMGPSQLVEQYPAILGAVLTNISTSSRDVQQVRGGEGEKGSSALNAAPAPSLPPPPC